MLLRIDVASGAAVLDSVELEQGGVMPLMVSRRYDSARTDEGPFGPGWQFGLDVCLVLRDGEIGVIGGWLDGVLFDAVAQGKEARLEDHGVTLQHHPDAFVLVESASKRWVFPKRRGATLRASMVKGASGSSIRLEHRDHQLQSLTTPEGVKVSLEWGGGRLLSISRSRRNRSARLRSYDYNARGELVAVTDAGGYSTRFGYDGGLLISVTRPSGNRQFACYDAEKRCVGIWDEHGNIALALFDPARMISRAWDREGSQHLFKHVMGKTVLERLTPSGHSQGYYYDEAERLVGFSDSVGGTVTFQRLDPKSGDFQQIDRQIGFIGAAYNDVGLLVQVVDASERLVRFEHHDLDTAILDNRESQWSIRRREGGKQVSIKSPEGREVAVERSDGQLAIRDSVGTLLRETLDDAVRSTLSSDGGGTQITRLYDNEGRLTQASCGTYSIDFLYDRDGCLEGSADSERRRWRRRFDTLGQPSEVEIDGRKFQVRHDAEGSLHGVAEGEGRRAILRRDEFGRVAAIEGPAGPVVTYGYDDAGAHAVSREGAKATYSSKGHLTRFANGDTVDELLYDAGGVVQSWIARIGDRERSAVFSYDDSGRLSQISLTGESDSLLHVAVKYDLDGFLVGLGVGDDTSVTMIRDDLGRPTEITSLGGKIICETDRTGRLVRVATESRGVQIAYDDLSRAVSVRGEGEIDFPESVDFGQPGKEVLAPIDATVSVGVSHRGVALLMRIGSLQLPLLHRAEKRSAAVGANDSLALSIIRGWQSIFSPPASHGPDALRVWAKHSMVRDEWSLLQLPVIQDVFPLFRGKAFHECLRDSNYGRQLGSLAAHKSDRNRAPHDLLTGTHRVGALRDYELDSSSAGYVLQHRSIPSPFSLTHDGLIDLVMG